jgi:hypothetical protein
MSDYSDFFRMAVPAIIIPLGVFSANWIYRNNKEYAQTAAADFILAVVIFDGSVVAASNEFEPFIHNSILRSLVVDWHIAIAIVGGLLWAGVLKWGEPVIAQYYESPPYSRDNFPIFTYVLCWMSVLALVTAHVTFFVING